MDIALRELQSRIRNVALDARNLSRVVESEAFRRAWDAATEDQRAQLAAYVRGIEKDEVDRWVRRVLSGTALEEKSVRELRALAGACGVTYVNHRSKEQLVEMIRRDALKPLAPGLSKD